MNVLLHFGEGYSAKVARIGGDKYEFIFQFPPDTTIGALQDRDEREADADQGAVLENLLFEAGRVSTSVANDLALALIGALMAQNKARWDLAWPGEIVVKLPLPSVNLAPNGGHGDRYVVARCKKEARDYAHKMTQASMSAPPRWKKADVLVMWGTKPSPLDKGYRPKDRDNAVAALKAALDGCASAGVVENDSGFSTPVVTLDPTTTGLVIKFREVS